MPKAKAKTHYGRPGAWAIARNQAGGDWAAASLLFRVKFYFQEGKKRLTRHGREWVAMSREDWAREAGLSEGEMKNRALPKLRKRQFMEIRQMKLSPSQPKLLWISLDLAKLNEWTEDPELFEKLLNGAVPPGYQDPDGSYPYKNEK